jgi:hypothetical protein
MSPGDRHQACVDVAVSNAGVTPRVFFGGQDVHGGLARALALDVQAGPADGRPCARFAGRMVFRGTVASLGATPSRAVTGWRPDRVATWRFRFTVTAARNAPLNSSASVGFAWHLSSAGGPVRPTPAGPPEAPSRTHEHVRHVVLARPSAASAGPIVRLLKVLAALVRHPTYPVGLLMLATLFVLLQDTVDRRDPKLALAPVRNDDLHFPAEPGEVLG